MTSSATSVAPFQGLKSTAGLPVSPATAAQASAMSATAEGSEFSDVGFIYRENSRSPGYYDGRYWTMWKLPMFDCTDSTQVYAVLEEAKGLDANLPEKRVRARFLRNAPHALLEN
ncbi:ribulose-1,5-bisphosphate carboxylase/oxygenase small subunit [Panicum miliaceum]|uniref:Ribulose-1,5-bisphosphate carboxylase/oxygenase small subunit n=1 Tax=Panicum miliaceum TaxID=4540 RepID=A0A3L6R5P0_PANMI|nr:ribulose-1,5-bisphosphate carboxylase/oxygenase small subunit [Panicum miliaceum]